MSVLGHRPSFSHCADSTSGLVLVVRHVCCLERSSLRSFCVVAMMLNRPKCLSSYQNRVPDRRRLGAAAAEFAVCLPMLMALTFGAVEATNAVFVKKALVEAAYEAGNVASSIGGTSSVAISRAQGVSTLLGVKSVTVKVSPTVTTNTATGTPITVTCTTNLASNSVTGWCIGNMTYTATYTVIHL